MEPTPQAQAVPQAQATPEAAALAVIDLARQGRFADITGLFAPQLRPMVPPEALRAAWESQIATSGPVAKVGTPVAEQAGPGTVVVKIPPSRPPPGSRRRTRTRRRSPSTTSSLAKGHSQYPAR